MPKVSVIIPTYNYGRYLIEAVESVLNQTYKDFELIVVDDGSTDNTREVLKPYLHRLRYMYQENQGISAARNRGFQESTGEYIAYLDADDVWLPEKLAKQIPLLDEDPSLGFVCGATHEMDQDGKIFHLRNKPRRSEDTFESLFRKNFIPTLTVVIRRSCLETVGGFDTSLPLSQDYDMWLRLAKRYKFVYWNIPLAKYRVHANNISKNQSQRLRSHLKIISKKEISGDMSWLKRRIRKAKVYDYFASLYYKEEHYGNAARLYFKATLTYPFLGRHYDQHARSAFPLAVCPAVIQIALLGPICFFKALRAR